MSGRERVWWFADGVPMGGWDQLPADPYIPTTARIATDWLEGALETLTPKQRFVIERSWGVNGFEQYSLREIAEFMGITHNAVARHYSAAMERLRHRCTNSPFGVEGQIPAEVDE